MSRSLFVWSCLLFAVPVVRAETIVVPTQFSTIQAAVDISQPGDEIVVLAGTYPEAVLLSNKSSLVLRAQGNATIDASTLGFEGVRSIGCQAIVVRGFKILAPLNKPGVRIAFGDGNEVRACRIFGGTSDAIRVEAGLRVTIRDCRIEDGGGIVCDGTAMAIVANKIVRSSGRGIDATGAAILIQGNTVIEAALDSIRTNGPDGIQVRNNLLRDGGGLLLQECDGCLAEGNVILRATSSGIRIVDEGAVLVKNTVAAPGAEGIVVLAPDVILRANKIVDAGTSGVFLGAAADKCVLDSNVVRGSDASGIFVDPGSINSLFFKNVAKNNAVFDLDDDAPLVNLYILNDIKKEKF